jgi:hypothetical protein
LDGHRETTFATVHSVAPFYSALIRVNPDNPSSTTAVEQLECKSLGTTSISRTSSSRAGSRKHGRHASMDTTMIYDDALSDFAGEVVKVVSEALEE